MKTKVHCGCRKAKRPGQFYRVIVFHGSLVIVTHRFPAVLPRTDGNKSKARRARPQAGSERAKQTASKKGK